MVWDEHESSGEKTSFVERKAGHKSPGLSPHSGISQEAGDENGRVERDDEPANPFPSQTHICFQTAN